MRDGEISQFGDPLLQWLPDESLFSLVSRLHRLWGRPLAGETAKILFGARTRGTSHDFSSGLDYFVGQTSGLLGLAQELAESRTLLRYFSPFIDHDLKMNAVAAMRGRSIEHLKFRLGLLTSRFRANHPLKTCPTCAVHDLRNYQWSYWHLSHQYPGVWHCPVHGDELWLSTVKTNGVLRFQWLLPDIDNLVDVERADISGDSSVRRSLSQMIYSIVQEAQPSSLSFASVQVALRNEIQRRGWMTSGGLLRLDVLAASYLEHCERIRGPCELSDLPRDLVGSRQHVVRLLRPIRSGTHPVRLLIGIHWLFKSAELFRTALAEVTNTGARIAYGFEAKSGIVGKVGQEKRGHIIVRLQAGDAPSRVATEFGVDFSTVASIAARVGIQMPRRPKVLKPEILSGVEASLRNGASLGDVATKFGVSTGTLRRILRVNLVLAADRESSIWQRKVTQAHQEWQELIDEHEALGIKLIRGVNPALYAWLYRNDRAWLAEHSPRAEALVRRAPAVAWDQRDRQLALDVQKAIEKIAGERQGRLQLWQIYQAVPQLRAKLGKLHRLARTRAILERALERPLSRNSSLI